MKVSEVIKKVRELNESDVLTMQGYVADKMSYRKDLSIKEAKKEVREDLKKLIRASEDASSLDEKIFEKLVLALALVNSYPVLKRFRRSL